MRIGTRRSALALAQAELVAGMLGGAEIVPLVTRGDRGARGGDKSRWVAELEQALLEGRIDLAVHSAKDLPGEPVAGLELLGSPARASAEDVLCGSGSLDDLAGGARVGTSSLRRLAQLRAWREDLEVIPLRGNVDTRLGRLAEGAEGLSAIVLARAGLERLGRSSEAGAVLDSARFVPAPGQGSLALEGRADDEACRAAVEALTDGPTFACLLAERALARALGADCDTPLGAHGLADGADGMLLRAWVGLPDGSHWIAEQLEGSLADPEALGREVAGRLLAAGAGELLQGAREAAAGDLSQGAREGAANGG
jgi:hydroxymethylbilane synthase